MVPSGFWKIVTNGGRSEAVVNEDCDTWNDFMGETQGDVLAECWGDGTLMGLEVPLVPSLITVPSEDIFLEAFIAATNGVALDDDSLEEVVLDNEEMDVVMDELDPSASGFLLWCLISWNGTSLHLGTETLMSPLELSESFLLKCCLIDSCLAFSLVDLSEKG